MTNLTTTKARVAAVLAVLVLAGACSAETADPAATTTQPVVDETPAQPVVEESPAQPVVEETPAQPVVEESPAQPVVEESPAQPVVEESPAQPVVEETPAQPVDVEQAPDAPVVETSAGGVLALLDALPVRAESARTGYDRDLFKLWTDADDDGCNTRREVLIAEAVTAPAKTADCSLSGGAWYSPYDGETEKTGTGRGFDVDHMVPLAEAWDSGAWEWGPDRREDFANDLGYPDSLVAVSARSNRSKSDQDPAEWQPEDAAARCWYASAWVNVKIRWELSADQREADALRGVLTGCDEADLAAPAPSAGSAPAPPEDTTAPPAEPAAPAGLDAALSDLRSKACGDWGAEDRALAGQAPDGYDWGRRDGNDDGVPCE